mmetsp:Transcript_17701/g.57259  ORF Transcript_17701/g.57259 Transcript_17701/m.57259 type:complete len:141 (+) Transcript_17701:197-619(+)|eukprot:CAMPEP_0182853788 /NCGR_PEP_ID=MMETSP0034_2-20130328/887_1 /TAXON_ID=156128 /ORGANISM="Nephroselmis pyriformis, Strain CCMP717" /LENGTH=140 /DNA_ID=CAMNT_0024984569 /DNA_START=169 /DNA_END=591 /DNA_ORIENTATION=-
MGKAPNNKNKGTKGTKFSKTLRNKLFLMRGVDQVWEDVRKEEGVTDGKTFGPLGTTTKGQLDEDIPGYGKFYCIACSKYFIDDFTLTQHNRSKPHKRRVKELKGVRPHNAEDAEQAGGLGPTDNGPRLRSAGAVAVEMAF